MLELTNKQKEFWRCANHRWNIKQGATRSGKTYLDYYMIPKRIRACTGAGLIVLLGNTRGTLNRNILEPMRGIWGDTLVGTIGSDNTVNLFGRKCHALGADKVSQVSKLQGAGIEYCYGDEVTTWNAEVFTMLKSRLDKPNSKFDGTCNPDSPNHWFKQFLDSDADIFQQHYTIDDNPFNSPDFVENLKREYAGTVYYDRYILGNWALAEGLVYPMFSVEKNVVMEMPENGDYYISVDYGTVNPCAMLLWGVNNRNKTATCIEEYYFDSRARKKQRTDEEHYAALEELAGERHIQNVVVDPSAASFIEVIRRHGRYPVQKAKNDVLDGIRLTGSLMEAGHIKIHHSCNNFIRELQSYCWDNNATEDQVIKDMDHACDSARYLFYTLFRHGFPYQGRLEI